MNVGDQVLVRAVVESLEAGRNAEFIWVRMGSVRSRIRRERVVRLECSRCAVVVDAVAVADLRGTLCGPCEVEIAMEHSRATLTELEARDAEGVED